MVVDQKKLTSFVNDEGYVVAWPIHSPAIAEYGDWAYVHISYNHFNPVPEITFVRQLTIDEINKIRRGYMVWGRKLPGVPWAQVLGREDVFGKTGMYDIVVGSSTRHSIGV
jgi:hypothetical protein